MASDTESVVETDLDTVSLSSIVTSSESARLDSSSTTGKQPSETTDTCTQVVLCSPVFVFVSACVFQKQQKDETPIFALPFPS